MEGSGRDVQNDFAGEGENVVQAGTIHGGIHFHTSVREKSAAPRQLPLPITGFVNRQVSISNLDLFLRNFESTGDQSVERPSNVSAIIGAPGVGKTALALRWAHKVRKLFPDGDLYIDMHGYDAGVPISAGQALDALLRSLGVRPEYIPESWEERSTLYQSMTEDKRILVLIDNVSSSTQVRPLLTSSSRSITLITSRDSLSSLAAREGAARVMLDVLSLDDAVNLLSTIVGVDRVRAAPEAAERVALLCGCLPLALRVVAERVSGRPQLGLDSLAAELLAEEERLNNLAADEDELVNVRAVFSWSYRALSSDLQRAFRLLSLNPGPDIDSFAASVLLGTPTPTTRRLLHQLSRVHLIQERVEGRFSLHDLLKIYSRECLQAEDTQVQQTQALRRLQSWYLEVTDRGRKTILPYSHAIPLIPVNEGRDIPEVTTVDSAMAWFESERLNIDAIIRQANELGQYDVAWKLPIVADGFFELRSYWEEWEEIHEAGLSAAESVGDPLGRASNHLCLGDVYWRKGNHESAVRHYQLAVELSLEVGDSWLRGFGLRGLGLLKEEQGEYQSAIGYFERALMTFRENGLHRGEAMSMLSLGRCHHSLGDLALAIANTSEAVSIFREINDTWSEGWALSSLATMLLDAGDSSLAQHKIRRSIAIAQQFGDRRSEALALVELGEILCGSGDILGATRVWSEAADIFESLGDTRAIAIRQRVLDSQGNEPITDVSGE